MRKTLISGVCVAAAVLAGCGSKTPTCADAETVNLVKQIYQQQFDKQHNAMSEERQQRVQFTVKDTTVALENITTNASNASTGKAVCSAQLTTVFPEDAVKAEPQMEQYMRAIYEKQGAVLDGTKLRGQVTYTAQRTEDTGALQVALNGFMPFMGYFHDIAMDRYDRMLRAQAAAKKAAETQTLAAPSASQAEMEAESEGAPQTQLRPQHQRLQHTSQSAAQPAPSQTATVSTLCSAEETPVLHVLPAKACIAVHDWQQATDLSAGSTGRTTRDGLPGQCCGRKHRIQARHACWRQWPVPAIRVI